MTTYVEGPLAGDVHRRLIGMEESIWQAGSFAPHAHRRMDAVYTPRHARPSSAPNAGRRQVRAPDPMPWHMQPRPHAPGAHRSKEPLAPAGFPRRQAGPARRPQSAYVGMAAENAGRLGPDTHLDRHRDYVRAEAAVYGLEDVNFSDELRAEAGYHGHVEYHASDATTHGGALWRSPAPVARPPSSSRAMPFGRPHSASSVSSARGGHGGPGRWIPSDSSTSSRSRAGRVRPSTAGGRSARSARSEFSDETHRGYNDRGGGRYFDDVWQEEASADCDASSSSSFAHQSACAWNGGLSRRVQLHNMEDQHHYGTHDNASVSGSSMTSYW